LNLYGFIKAKRALSFGAGTNVALLVFLVIMVFSPILVRVTERFGYELLARLVAYIGYIWMGFLFLFVSASLVIDIYHLLVFLVRSALSIDLSRITLSPRNAFFIPLALCLAITVYGYFEAIGIKTEHVLIRTPKIGKETAPLKIAQISDVHLGLIVREKRLRRILDKVKDADPDIFVSTGDLVDGQIDDLSGLAEMLSDIKPRYGKFAVVGNHEFYAGLGRSLDFIKKAGFTILRGNGLPVSGPITVVGIDDPAAKMDNPSSGTSEKDLISSVPTKKFLLLLKHRPSVDKETVGLFDLQLSGHTHKGQIFPFSLVTGLSHPANAGHYSLQKNSHLYVSRGSGTWGPPIRFLSPPEVTIIELVHGEK